MFGSQDAGNSQIVSDVRGICPTWRQVDGFRIADDPLEGLRYALEARLWGYSSEAEVCAASSMASRTCFTIFGCKISPLWNGTVTLRRPMP